MAESGHIFSMYQQTVYFTWRKSSRLWDKLVVEVRWMIWITSMWTQLYGYICVCYSSSCSSSWARLCGKSAIYQESTFEVCETEITGLSTIDWKAAYVEKHLCYVVELFILPISKPTSFSDSVLCLGGTSPEPVQAWKDIIKWYLETRYLKELYRINGELMKFEWNNFPECTTLGISLRFKR